MRYQLAISMLLLATESTAATSRAARIGAVETGLRPATHVQGTNARRWTLAERMKLYGVPGVSIAVIRAGRVAWARGYGVLQAGRPDRVDAATLFSIGSLSKVATAAVTLRLVDAGRLDLDTDVARFVTRWHLPPDPFTAVHPVTLRGLLSHTAGLSLNGFPDFLPGATLPTITETLSGSPPSQTEAVQVEAMPGTIASYSGGGTMLEQLVIEDVVHEPLESVATHWLFAPLGMTRSTFVNPLPARWGNVAKAHYADGSPAALPRGYEAMPEAGASGLWTTPSDYARLLIAWRDAWKGTARPFLTQPLARQSLTEVGVSPVGLGPFLDGAGFSRRMSHSGSNDSYKAWFELYLERGDGVVIFTNGAGAGPLRAEIRRAVAAAEGWPGDSTRIELPAVTLSPAELRALTGLYVSQPPHGVSGARYAVEAGPPVYRVAIADGALTIGSAQPGTSAETLIPADPTHFVLASDADRRVEFVHGYDGKVERIILRGGAYAIEAVAAASRR